MATTLKNREEKAMWAIIKLKKLTEAGFHGQITISINDGNIVQLETRQTEKPPVDSYKP